MPEGAARSGVGSRQGKSATSVGTHQIPDDRRFYDDQGAGLDRCRANEEGLRPGADLSRDGEAVRGGERFYHQAARYLDQDGREQGQEVRYRFLVMPGLVPGIHVLAAPCKTWMGRDGPAPAKSTLPRL